MFYLMVDSNNAVSFNVEYDFEDESTQIKSEHVSRSGRKYTYKWGEIRRRSFSVRFLSSSTASIINSWWQNNASLQLYEGGALAIFSCKLANESTPINRFEKPHNDLYKGVIELESY
jgi:hypothetical protein